MKCPLAVCIIILFLGSIWSGGVCYGESGTAITPTAKVDLRAEIAGYLKQLVNDNPLLQEEARQELLEIGKPAVELLIEALGGERSDLRFMAAEILSELRDERALPALLKLLKDTSGVTSSVASVAARALGRLGNSEVITPLAKCLPTLDVELRYEVVRALGTLRAMESIPQILPLITDTAKTNFGYSVRAAVITTLGKLRAREAAKELVKLLRDNEAEPATEKTILNYVIKALEKITGLSEGPLPTTDDKKKEEFIKKWEDWWEKHKVEYGEVATPPSIPPVSSPVTPTGGAPTIPAPTAPLTSTPITPVTPTPIAPSK